MPTHFALLLVASASFLAVAPGCFFGGSVPEPRYFTLHTDSSAPAATSKQPRYPIRVGVEEFKIASEYRSERIVYRESPYELGYYNYARWAASPEVLVRRKFKEHLVAANLFAAVDDASLVKPDLSIEGTVERIEEVDEGDRASGRVVLELSVRDPGEKLPIVQRRYDLSRPAAGRKALEVVKAMSAALDEAIRSFIPEVEKALARRKSP